MQPGHPSSLFVNTLLSLGVNNAVTNIQTELDLLDIDGKSVPLTLNHAEYNNSYVCSPYTAYISYARDELELIRSQSQREFFKAILWLADHYLRGAKINQTVSVNNWLVSTNLPPNWNQSNVTELTGKLLQRYPNHSFHIRSLNTKSHSELMQSLQESGWQLIPARQVYLFDNQERDWWQRSHTKRDQKLLRNTLYEQLAPQDHTEEDFVEIHRCFNQLFIEKHSQYNPQFSAEYLYQMHQQGLMQFYSFRDPQEQRIVASIALFTQEEIITTPIVGYDTSLPKELGLYRLLMAKLLKITYESGKLMNLSSGAGSFKRARGGEATIEYTAFYIEHLPCIRKNMLKIFAGLVNRYGPKVLAENEI